MFGSEALLSIVELLPKKAEVTLSIVQDAGTNEYLRKAVRGDVNPYLDRMHPFEGLCCDHLYVEAVFERDGKTVRRRYLLDTSIAPHNARFCVSD